MKVYKDYYVFYLSWSEKPEILCFTGHIAFVFSFHQSVVLDVERRD